jgi:hypothetical protein
VLVGHSIDSVVAYEAAHGLEGPLSLLVTLASPLRLQAIVYEGLRPQPPGFPRRSPAAGSMLLTETTSSPPPGLTRLSAPGSR